MSFRAFALILAMGLFATGCRTPLPAVPLQASDERPHALLAALAGEARARRSMRGVARISLDGPAGSGRAKQLMVVERPAHLRVEVLGFLDQTVAILVTDGQRYHLFRSEDRSLHEGLVHPRLLEEIAGVRLTPEEAVDVVLGTPKLDRDARAAGGALLPGGAIRVDLAPGSGVRVPALEFDREARLRRFAVRGESGAVLWEARFGDYRCVGPAPFAHSIELRFPQTGARARLSFGDVELNPELPPDIFVLHAPGATGSGGGGEG